MVFDMNSLDYYKTETIPVDAATTALLKIPLFTWRAHRPQTMHARGRRLRLPFAEGSISSTWEEGTSLAVQSSPTAIMTAST